MAKSRANKKMGIVGMELPECPVCLETMSAPIYNCVSGHSLCSTCTANLCPSICPICRQPMTQIRNRTLEDLISKAKVHCPNQSSGCIYTLMAQEVDAHLKECVFREMACPLSVFGKCSWNGKCNEMLNHFKERHPENCNISADSDVEFKNVSVMVDERYVYLVAQGKQLFILTVKIDTIQKMAFWIVQLIGSKSIAQQHVYEIHVISKQDSRRKVMFTECCFNDAMKPDEIIRQGKCGIMPLNSLNNFIKDKKLGFRFLIKRNPVNPNQKLEKGGENQHFSKGPNVSGPQGPGKSGGGPRGVGYRGAGARGSGHRGRSPRHKSPGFINSDRQSPSLFVNSVPQGQFKHPFRFDN